MDIHIMDLSTACFREMNTDLIPFTETSKNCLHSCKNVCTCYTQRFPLLINDRIAQLTRHEEILISNYPEQKACIIFAGKVLKEDAYFKVQPGLKQNANGRYYGKNLGIVFSENTNCIYLGAVNGLNGGGDYNKLKSYKNIIEKIHENKNPFVIEELNSILGNENIYESRFEMLSNSNLPYDIKKSLQELIEEVPIKPILIEAFKNISITCEEFVDNQQYWSLFSILLELNCIKKMRVTQSRKIIESIMKNASADDIIELIVQKKKAEDEDQLTEEKVIEELKERWDAFSRQYQEFSDIDIMEWNLTTLIKQINKKKPTTEKGFLAHLNDGEKFFKGKLFILQDPLTYRFYIRDQIQTFYKNYNAIEIRFLSGNARLWINKTEIEVNFEIEEEIGLVGYLEENKTATEIHVSRKSRFISFGYYKVESRIKKPGIIAKICTSNSVKHIYRIDNEVNSYKIKLIGKKKYADYEKIIIKNLQDKETKEYFSLKSCNLSEKICKVNPQKLKIPNDKVKLYIKIEEYEDTNQKRLDRLKLIKEESTIVHNKLEKHHRLRKLILNSYIESGLTTLPSKIVNLPELQTSEINQSLKEIMKCKLQLNEEIEIATLLKNLALAANYQYFIKKQKSVDLEQAMNLLSKSSEEATLLNNKDIIFLIGGTGCGKSTTACYLLGASLKMVDSGYGEMVAKVTKDIENFPIIGQLLGTSETVYAKGYRLQGRIANENKNIVLCDCPGFHDTRGTDYELCTNLSIDRTIRNSRRIKAMLLVIPYASFTINRGRELISEMDNLIDLFPNFMEDYSLLDSIFLLITKANQAVTKEALQARAEQNIREVNLQIEKSIEENAEVENNYFLLNLWQKIVYLIDKDHVIIMDVTDVQEKAEILKLVLNSPGIDKNSFTSTLLSKKIITEYSNLIEMSTHTWVKNIMPKFLIIIPKELSISEDKRSALMMKVTDEIKNQQMLNEEIKLLENNRLKILNELSEIGNIIENFNLKTIGLNEVNAYIEKVNIKKACNSNSDKERLFEEMNRSFLYSKRELERLEQEKGTVKNKIEEYNASISSLEKRVQELSAGSKEIILDQSIYKPSDLIFVSSFKPGARETARNEIRELTDEDCIRANTNSGFARDYKGKMNFQSCISKDYRIVPKENQSQFFLTGHSVQSEGKTYLAKIEGYNYKILGEPKADSTGRKMIWSIETLWLGSGNKLPWFKIIHTIPNIDVNAATIINLDSEINSSKAEISRLQATKKILKDRIIDQIKITEERENEYIKEKSRYENEKKIEFDENLESIKQEFEKSTEEIIRNLKFKNGLLAEIPDRILNLQAEIKECIDIETSILQEKKHLALLIKTQLTNADTLYEFCYSFAGDSALNVGQRANEVLKNCYEYTEMYYRERNRLIELVNKELGVSEELLKQNS